MDSKKKRSCGAVLWSWFAVFFDGFGSTWFQLSPSMPLLVDTSTLTTARLINKSPAVDTWTTRHDHQDQDLYGSQEHLWWKKSKGDHLFDMRTPMKNEGPDILYSVQTLKTTNKYEMVSSRLQMWFQKTWVSSRHVATNFQASTSRREIPNKIRKVLPPAGL